MRKSLGLVLFIAFAVMAGAQTTLKTAVPPKKPALGNYKTLEEYTEALKEWKFSPKATGSQCPRFQIVFNPGVRADTFLLDTETGRIWRMVKMVDAVDQPDVWIAEDRIDSESELKIWSIQHPKQDTGQSVTKPVTQ